MIRSKQIYTHVSPVRRKERVNYHGIERKRHGNRLSGSTIPNTDCSIVRGCYDKSSFRIEARSVHAVLVLHELAYWNRLPTGGVPKLNGVVIGSGCRDQQLPIGTELCVADARTVFNSLER